MEVMVQSPSRSPTNFDLTGTMSSPYLSAPSSPKHFGEYYSSAPTSPSRLSEFYSDFDNYFSTSINIASPNSSSTNPFEAATNNVDGDDDDGFAFFVSRESENSSLSAEELFDGGKIKPLKPEGDELLTSHKSTLVSQKQHNKSPLAEERNKVHFGDPSESAKRRGRDRTPAAVLSSSNSGRRVTRSHSPYRVSHYTWEEEHRQQQQPRSNKEESTLTSSSNSKGSSRRWRLRDLLLFRSASEGRGSSKDVLKSVLYKKHEEVVKTSSFRSSDSSATGSRRKGHVSAHELHYAMKRAESKDMKKKTFLPYKQGILGRLAGFGI